MTREELKQYDGREGRRAYVAYKGRVYDVTESPLWEAGEHQGMHVAGEDLTEALEEAPHGDDVFGSFTQVAELDPPDAAPQVPLPEEAEAPEARLRSWYRRYHPHPATVHFPIALHLFAAGLDLLFFADPRQNYADAVFYSFLAATVGGAVAMVPGILSWWVNYHFLLSRPFVVKLLLSLLSLLLGVAAIVLYLGTPGIAYSHSGSGVIYHGIVLFTGAAVIVIGYYGGKLTWPEGRHAAAETPPETETFALRTDTMPSVAAQPLKSTGQGRSVALLVGGAAGSGIQSLELLLAEAFREAGYYLFATKEYMSRVRGGSNTTLIRVGDMPLEAACWEVDLFVALDAEALEHGGERCTDRTLVIADAAIAGEGVIALPMRQRARELGSPAYVNSYAAGALFALLGLGLPLLQACIRRNYASRSPEENAAAAAAGYEAGTALERPAFAPLPQPPLEGTPLHLMGGTAATGFGFLAGGCDFVASYPMSPSTGVLSFMASMAQEFEVVVEQSEDEIAAANMVIGAWYAGARAATTTSGGGFALMGEAISLAGMSETPAVIYLAQRPGPATGLPTRTEQGDFDLALHAGHGDFPRLLLAPGSVQECIDCGHLAFVMADCFQVPVVVLSDQYLADSVGMIGPRDLSAYSQERHIGATEEDYRRYAASADGISPRGVPGHGEGRVCAVSDEHDERGQITESYAVREAMVTKRLQKLESLRAAALPPESVGEGTIAVVGWGSTKGAIAEALRRLDDKELFQVHFFWLHPLAPESLEPLRRAAAVIVVENNATGQFARQLEGYGIAVDRRVLQADGFPFFADRLAVRLENVLKELR